MSQKLRYPSFGTTEDLILGLLRPWFAAVEAAGGPKVNIYTDYQEGMVPPFVLVMNTRRTGIEAYATKEDNWARSAVLEVNTVCDGTEAERDAADLQESVRHCLIEAQANQTVVPNVGVINQITTPVMATRQTDWASASGPVQYAKLPHGQTRYEGRYRLIMRPPSTYENQFLAPFDGSNHT